MTTIEKTDVATALYARLPAERRRDRYETVTVPAEEVRAALDEVRAARRCAEQAEARVEKTERRARTVDSANGSLQVDRDRARTWAAELAESALRVAAERGIDAEDVRAQIAHDRHLRWLQLREETGWSVAFWTVAELAEELRHKDPAATMTVRELREVLKRALDPVRRDREIDRRCGKTSSAKATLPDLEIPPRREHDPADPGRLALMAIGQETREALALRTYDDDPLVVLGAALAAASSGSGLSGVGGLSGFNRQRVALQAGTLRRIRDEFARARRAGWIPEPRPSDNPYAPPDGDVFAELVSALVHCETADEIEHLRGGRNWAPEHDAVAALRLAELQAGAS